MLCKIFKTLGLWVLVACDERTTAGGLELTAWSFKLSAKNEIEG